jgi:hypothetical protein
MTLGGVLYPFLCLYLHFRYRLVPYGNHSYLESLTDKSKVLSEALFSLVYKVATTHNKMV